MSFVATAVIGGAVIGAGASIYAGRKSSKAISQGAESAADAQVQAAQIAADQQREMYYTSLGLQAPQRYAGNMALESLMREVYGSGFNMPEGFNRYNTYANEAGGRDGRFIPDQGQTVYPAAGSGSPGGLLGLASSIMGGQRGPGGVLGIAGNLADQYSRGPEGGQVAQPAIVPLVGTGFRYNRTAPSTPLPHAPQVDIGTSKLYQLQRTEGEEGLAKQLAARGLTGSGAGLELYENFYRKLAASEAARKEALLESLAGYGNAASSQGASAANSLGSSLAGLYSGMGDARAQAYQTSANARAGQWANIGNVIGQTTNLGLQLYGMYGGFGGGGGAAAPTPQPTGIWT